MIRARTSFSLPGAGSLRPSIWVTRTATRTEETSQTDSASRSRCTVMSLALHRQPCASAYSNNAAWVVPGSVRVKRAAEAEGLDRVFRDAGFDWREPGCSLCVAANGEAVPPGARCVSTSNRNFVGRQGKGARTHLASPAMAAAAAVTGRITDIRRPF